jgi:hypothetical protein
MALLDPQATHHIAMACTFTDADLRKQSTGIHGRPPESALVVTQFVTHAGLRPRPIDPSEPTTAGVGDVDDHQSGRATAGQPIFDKAALVNHLVDVDKNALIPGHRP